MMRPSRLLKASVLLVQVFRIANAVAIAFFFAVLIATLPGAELVGAALARKYGPTADIGSIILFMQVTMLLALPIGYAIERLLIALRAILRTVEDDEPFALANAARLRTIGWMMLIVQFADLGYGIMAIVARSLRIDHLAWQPGFTGWIAVLVAFVLAQVFERGAAMRDDLAGTV
jgi:hypothetical protein